MTNSPSRFFDFKNLHHDKTFIICGCGSSLKEFVPHKDVITVGVNDVERLFTPDYLVVLNSKSQFKDDRFNYVERSKAKALFTQLNLKVPNANVVRFTLGKRGGTDFSGEKGLPFTRNSPYVALCLALYMGAKRVGIIGVDFTEHHFFLKSGRHPLSRNLKQINLEYQRLNQAARENGVDIVNLSATSLLKAFPKQSLNRFVDGISVKIQAPQTPLVKASSEKQGGSIMRLEIEKHRGGLIGGFLDGIARSAEDLGYAVSRNVTRGNSHPDLVRIVWNGRRYHKQKNVIYCEHGWLPREAFQISYRGINADSHIASFSYQNNALNEMQTASVHAYLNSLREQNTTSSEYMLTTAPAVQDLPEAFLLCPLQLESDTNIMRHAPANLRRMQALVDYLSRWNPSIPIIFKQHPSDAKKYNQQLLLRLRRRKDRLRKHSEGNIHQILKTGACKGIISINSNVVHDGFLWGVPAIVLGKNIWPREGVSPFMNDLPKQWQELERFYSDQQVENCRNAYIHYVTQNQWTMEDANDCTRVAQLLNNKNEDLRRRGKLTYGNFGRKPIKKAKYTVNVVAENKGWLFEDLKKYYAQLSIPEVSIVASNKPQRFSDAWIFLRVHEARQSPDLSRTLIQIHDQFNVDSYREGGNRHCVNAAGALCLTNMAQKQLIQSAGVDLTEKKLIVRAMGAHRDFTLCEKIPDEFTVGWVGRPVNYQGREIKRLAWLHTALGYLDKNIKPSVHLIGDRLLSAQKQMAHAGINCHYFPRSKYSHSSYPSLFKKLDCLVITAEHAAGPNALFEALATGIPVIATRCGWVSTFIRHNVNGYLIDSPQELASAITTIAEQRDFWFGQREHIRRSLGDCWLQSWLEESVWTAVELTRKEQNKSSKSA